MANKIAKRYATLTITDDETNVIPLDDDPDDHDGTDITLYLVGKVMTNRPCNFEAMKKTMNQIWSISKGALFRRIEDNLFVAQFASLRDKTKFLARRPWNFDQNLILLNEIDGGEQPSNIKMTTALFGCVYKIYR